MSQHSKIRAAERKKKQERQAHRIINGIFVVLVVVAIVCIALAAFLSD